MFLCIHQQQTVHTIQHGTPARGHGQRMAQMASPHRLFSKKVSLRRKDACKGVECDMSRWVGNRARFMINIVRVTGLQKCPHVACTGRNKDEWMTGATTRLELAEDRLREGVREPHLSQGAPIARDHSQQYSHGDTSRLGGTAW